ELLKRLAISQCITEGILDVGQQIKLHAFGDRESVAMLLTPHIAVITARLQLLAAKIVQRLFRRRGWKLVRCRHCLLPWTEKMHRPVRRSLPCYPCEPLVPAVGQRTLPGTR